MVLLPGKQQEDKKDLLYARDGWLIPTTVAPPETFDALRRRNKEVVSWFPKAKLRSISHPNYSYNCVGMIFASRRKWIEIDYIEDILIHDGYRKISLNESVIGDVVLYHDYNGEYAHVALITYIGKIGDTIDIRVLSKWGRDGEFEHFVADIPPYCGKPTEYWTERQLL